jgi:acetyltransferase-like isoleucine patch superfamily enzyme
MMPLLHLQRLLPVVGMAANAIRFPGLRAGLRVEFEGPAGALTYGKGVRLGEGTRIQLLPGSRLDIGDTVAVSRGVHVSAAAGQRIRIGARTTIQDNCRIYGDVSVGRECILAPNVFLSSGTHAFDMVPHRFIHDQEQLSPAADRPIRIFDDCWLGINSVLTPGVTVGRGCILGANSVLTQDLPPYSVAAGNPARIVRQRLAFQPGPRIDATEEQDAPYFYQGFDSAAAADPAEKVADPDFILALHRPDADAVRLCLSGSAGDIVFGRQRKPLPREPGVIQFELEPGDRHLPFLSFHAADGCRVRWAELV